MRVTLKAIADYLQSRLDATRGTGLRITVHRHSARGVAAPYVILTASPHPRRGRPLGGAAGDEVSGDIVTINVHATEDGATWVADRVRSVLSPNLRPLRVPHDDKAIEVIWDDGFGTSLSTDRDVTLPGTNSHPGVAHEGYLFSAHAIEPESS